MKEYYLCKNCGHSVTCVYRDDPDFLKDWLELNEGDCPMYLYRPTVKYRSNFR